MLRPLRKLHALVLGKQATIQVIVEAIGHDAGQHRPGNEKQGDATVVVTGVSVSFTLVEVDYGSVFKLLWQYFFRPHRVEQAGEGID